MPKINLKPNSPEFCDNGEHTSQKICEMPGCTRPAEHKAPKDRQLSGYLFLCLDHVREYNQAWDFFGGMSDFEIYEHMVKSAMWDRPTWSKHANPNDQDGSSKHHSKTNGTSQANRFAFEEELYKKAQFARNGHSHDPNDPTTDDHFAQRTRTASISPHSPEGKALQIMDLEPPLNLDKIKHKYKLLMKQHHPDLRRGDKDSEELVKKINMAYTVLKIACRKYEELYKDGHPN